MATRKEKSARAPEAAPDHRTADILALAFFAAGLIGLLSLASYHADDRSFGAATGTTEVKNLIGPFGANLAWALLEIVGYVAWLVPVGLFAAAVAKFRRRGQRLGIGRLLALSTLLLSSSSVLALALGAMVSADHFPPGGLVGRVLAAGLVAALGGAGAWIVGCTLAVASALIVTKLSLKDAAAGAGAATSKAAAAMRGAGRLATGLLPREAADDEESTAPPRTLGRAAVAAKTVTAADDDEEEEDDDVEDTAPPRPARGARPATVAARAGEAKTVKAEPTPAEPRSRLFHLKLKLRKPASPNEVPEAPAPPPRGPALALPRPTVAAPRSAIASTPRALEPATEPTRPATPPPRAAEPAALAQAPAPAPAARTTSDRPPERTSERAPRAAEAARAASAPARSTESGFLAPAAREVAATADSDEAAPFVGERAQVARAVKKSDSKHVRDFRLPPTKLLDEPGEQFKVDEAELMECAKHIVDKCAEFGVGGQVLHIHPGPVVTTYELKPDAGVKFSRICSLEDDLAMALKAETIRIDRIPGKNTVGIEVPNRRREVISFRELAESDVFVEGASKLTMILGKTIDGAPYVADLAKMPHLLIAGSTGSGKSVCLNSMITSLLFKATPEEVKLIMVDPKMLELGIYKDIPHLLTPVVTNPKLASNALRWGVKEMETRYARLAGCGVRNIEQYNAWVKRHEEKEGAKPTMKDGSDHTALPYIVIIIDELADLMMIAAADVEDSICRLAQMARAVGIHLILATQRPSVDVITGVIKANLPARIAMRVASKVDSRTILDSNGSEQLLGKGDMLFLPSGSSRLMRLHGPYLSETETMGICDYLRGQRDPVYDEKVVEEDAAAAAGADGGPGGPKDDELFEQAARIVVERGEASVSYLQRRLKVGYSRAARLVDMLEADGIVSPADGSKAREVLVGPDYFAELDRARQATT